MVRVVCTLLLALLLLGVPVTADAQAQPTAKPAEAAAEQPASDPSDPSNKALVVLVFDQTCHAWCGQVRPMMSQLHKDYGDRVAFEEIDATRALLKPAMNKAKQLGIGGYLPDVMDQIPIVLFFTTRRKFVDQLSGPKSKQEYEAVVKKALQKK